MVAMCVSEHKKHDVSMFDCLTLYLIITQHCVIDKQWRSIKHYINRLDPAKEKYIIIENNAIFSHKASVRNDISSYEFSQHWTFQLMPTLKHPLVDVGLLQLLGLFYFTHFFLQIIQKKATCYSLHCSSCHLKLATKVLESIWDFNGSQFWQPAL